MTPRLFWHVLLMEGRKLMSYRGDFWLQAGIGILAQFGISYYVWQAMYTAPGFAAAQPLSFESMVLYSMLALLTARIIDGEGMDGQVATDIFDGGLTRYLIYPTSYLGFKYAQRAGSAIPAIAQVTIFAIVYLAVTGLPADSGLGPATIAMGMVSMAAASLMNFLMVYPIEAVAFWAENVWSLWVMLHFIKRLLGGLWLPLYLFPEAIRELLPYTPFPHLFYTPTMTFLGKVSSAEWAWSLAVCLAWCGILYAAGRAVWRRGMYAYVGVGI